MSQGKRMKEEPKNGKKGVASQKNSKRRNPKLDGVLKLLAFVYVVITIIFYIAVRKVNMLPTSYTVIFTIAEIIFTILMIRGILKNRKSLKINIICIIIVLFVSGIYIYATNYLLATSNFLGKVFREVTETEQYYIIARKDSSYNKIEDVKGKDIYLFQIEDSVKKDLTDKVTVTLKSEENLTDLGKKLLNKDIDTVFVSLTQYEMLSEEIKEFKDNTKIIYIVNHDVKVSTKIETTDSRQTINNGIFNVYISGIDTTGSINNVARSDANILATVNTKTHEVLLTSIPRDYYVTLHSKKAKDKLTHSGIYGVSETVTTVEDLLDIDINYYVRVNFTTVIKLVDTIGGIDVYSNYNFSTNTVPSYTFSKGYNHLNGNKALAYSRERYSFADGDNQRVKNQQQVIEAIINKVLDSKTILTKYTSILNSMEGSFQTNISQDEVSKLVQDQLNNMSSWKILNNSLTGTGSYGPTYSMGSQELYIMLPDSTSVQNVKQQIKSVMDK